MNIDQLFSVAGKTVLATGGDTDVTGVFSLTQALLPLLEAATSVPSSHPN